MAIPTQGLIKIFPDNITIVSGEFAYNSDAAPQPIRTAANLDTYYGARVANIAIAPCLSRNVEKPAASGIYVPFGGGLNYELSTFASHDGIEFYSAYPGAIEATVDFLSANFPIGMTINSIAIWFNGQILFTAGDRDRAIASLISKFNTATVETYTPGAIGLFSGTRATPSNGIIDNPLKSWSVLQALGSFGFNIPVNTVASVNLGIPRAVITEFFLLATYSIVHWSFTLNTPNAIPGEIVDIEDASSGLDAFDEYKIYWDDPDNPSGPLIGGVTIPTRYFFIRTKSRIRFQIPRKLGIPYGGRRLMVVGKGVGAFFVGEFPIANLNIFLADGSGLYQLTDGQRHDTYYDRSALPAVTTVNLKFPRPGFRTGFF